MKKVLLYIICMFVSTFAVAQQPSFQWAKRIGGTSDDSGTSITTDASSVYTTGSSGSNAMFITKMDVSGNPLWTKNVYGGSYINSRSLKVDNSGNVYTTGYFYGSADFDPGSGIYNMTSSAYDNIFILKLDASGNFLWAKRIGGASGSHAESITVDMSGSIYTTGLFQGTVDFDPGAGTLNLISSGGADIFVLKLDSSGTFVWAKNMGGTGYDYGRSLSVDANKNVYTTGIYNSTSDFDPNAGISNLTSLGGYEIFISKLDSLGNYVWAKSLGGSLSDAGNSIVTGNNVVYITGSFQGTANLKPDKQIF